MDSAQAKITIGQTLMSATAGLVPVLAALVTFVYESRNSSWPFWLFILVAAFLYLTSIMLGGWGIEETAAGKSHSHFNNQAVALLFGTLALIAAFASTSARVPVRDPLVVNLQAELLVTKKEIGQMEERIKRITETVVQGSGPCKSPTDK